MQKLDYSILENVTLLYVEDDKYVQEAFSKQLKSKIGTVYIADDGQEGYDKYLKYKPDIILTDINMPVVSGLEMAAKIRIKDDDTSIFVITAYNDTEFITQSLYLNISGYLVKPVNEKELFSMLVSRTKLINAKKDSEKNIKMLQSIINADIHYLAVTDLENVLFVNQAFMGFLNLNSVDDFNTKYGSFMDLFLEQDDHIHKSLLGKNENLMELILRIEPTKRNVMIFDFNKFTPKAFQFNLTPIERIDNKDIYLATFIDISFMILEKVAMKNKVYHDNLTGIYNRNKIDEVFKSEVARASRYKEVFSMILVDIDHFKNFNDTYGHLVGDEVLVLLAQNIDKFRRDTDTFARWGGEEFVMILPNTNKINAKIVAEHLRKKVRDIKHAEAGGITASFGVCHYEQNDTEKDMYEKCDKALYKAKENGRDRVEVI